MIQKTLFEIPIYSMPEKEFKKRWDKWKSEVYNSFVSHGHSDESARMGLHAIIYPEDVWKYNQIVGYIVISVSKNDVWFDIYMSLYERYRAISRTKHFIQNTHVNGLHFHVTNENDVEIHGKIKKWLSIIEKDNIRKTMFVDYSVFDNTFEAVDIRKIMSNIVDS